MALEKLLSLFREKPAPDTNAPVQPAHVAPQEAFSRAEAAMPYSATAAAEAVPPVTTNAVGIQEHAQAGMPALPLDAPAGPPPDLDELRETIIRQIRTIFDPEIPVNIYDLGLIYEIHLNDAREALVRMTLTAPNCPSAEELPVSVDAKVRAIPGITGVQVELVWEPSWNKDMMSDVARLELGM